MGGAFLNFAASSRPTERSSLEIEEASERVVDDEVVERDGVQIFLDPVAASALDDQVIGVHAHDDHFHFTFDDQPE